MPHGSWLALGALLTLLPVWAVSAEPKDPKAQAEVKLQTENFEGIQKAIQRHKGKVVIVDAWATWCPPCVKEFPNLVKLHKQHGAKGLVCVSLSFDNDGLEKLEVQQERVLKFLKEQGATFDNLMSTEDSDTLFRKMDIPSVPAVLIYGKDGKLLEKFNDEKAYEKAIPILEKLLAEK